MRIAALFLLVGLIGTTGGASAAQRGEDPTLLPVHGAALTGDVDGDGYEDVVAVHCRAGGVPVLVVSAFPSPVARRLRTGCGVASRVVVLAKIDRHPGAEIVVLEAEGSARFAAIYTWRGKGLVRMKFKGSPDGWFTYSGAVTHDAAADCVGRASGRLILSLWVLRGDRGIVTRTYLRVVGTTFRVQHATHFFTRSNHLRYRDFRAPQPFPSCTIDRDPTDAAAQHPKARRATLVTFAGFWVGHTRRLTITRSGHAHEVVGDGCCHPVIDLKFQLLQPLGTANDARVTFRVSAVKLFNKKIYWKTTPGPHIGQLGQLRLKNGVITETVTGTNFCAPHRNACGA